MNQEPCPQAVPWTELEALWLGELDDDAAQRLDTHLFTCESCTQKLERLALLAAGIRSQAQRGRSRGSSTRELIERLGRSLNVRRYDLQPGDRIECTATAHDDLVVVQLSADIGEAARVDLTFTDVAGLEVERARDLPIVGRTAVFWAERGEDLRRLPEHDLNLQLLAVDAAGERVLAEYALHHLPFQG